MKTSATTHNYDPWRRLLAAITWRTIRDVRSRRTPLEYRQSAIDLLRSEYYTVWVKDVLEIDLLAR